LFRTGVEATRGKKPNEKYGCGGEAEAVIALAAPDSQ